MKTFAALLVLGAFAAYVSANKMAAYRAVTSFLRERHNEKMAQVLRDQGLPENSSVANPSLKPTTPEIPDWEKPCNDSRHRCWEEAELDACKKLNCTDNYFKCLKENHPTPLHSLSPFEEGCFALFDMCRQQSPSCAGELCCFVRINRCFELEEKVSKE